MNLIALLEACIAHVLSTPTLQQFVFSTFVVFFVVYRYNVQRRIRYRFNIESSSALRMDASKWQQFKSKFFSCESCFGFWLCLLISTNLTTAAAAFLLYNYYEQDRRN